jgi:hypothetical protein
VWFAAKVFKVGLLMHGKPPILATSFAGRDKVVGLVRSPGVPFTHAGCYMQMQRPVRERVAG